MPEATGGGLTTDISNTALFGWKWFVFDVLEAGAEKAVDGATAAIMFYQIGKRLGETGIEFIEEQQKKNRRFLIGTGVTAAAIIAGSIALNLKQK